MRTVKVTDDDLGDTGKGEWPVVRFGEVDLDDDEELVLRMRPEFALFPRLSLRALMEEFEACLTKVRWGRNAEDRAREEARVAQEAGEVVPPKQRGAPYDMEQWKWDMAYTEPTDLNRIGGLSCQTRTQLKRS